MNVIENKTNKNVEDIIAITSRVNNKKRSYLLLNKLQAKYVPVRANEALEMFDLLAEELKYIHGNIIVVGFAETATAIGARIASDLATRIDCNVTFLPTTREPRPSVPVCEFKEEHSHAVEQILYGNSEMFKKADWVVFAEDEVTTGNTIRNCVKQLREIYNCNYAVASLLNCMSDEEMQLFKRNNIEAYWLIKTGKEGLEATEPECEIRTIETVVPDPRLGVKPHRYDVSITQAANIVEEYIHDRKDAGRVLILGTEECMYPAIKTADILSDKGYDIKVSATTRVPTGIEGPITNKHEVESLYGDRKTYLYSVGRCDTVVVMTDGTRSADQLCSVLWENYGAKVIVVVRLIAE